MTDTLTPHDLVTLERLGMLRVLGRNGPDTVYELTPIGRVIVERLLNGEYGAQNPRSTRHGRGIANARRRMGRTSTT